MLADDTENLSNFIESFALNFLASICRRYLAKISLRPHLVGSALQTTTTCPSRLCRLKIPVLLMMVCLLVAH